VDDIFLLKKYPDEKRSSFFYKIIHLTIKNKKKYANDTLSAQIENGIDIA
jgi:hypothetical protein